MFVVINNLPYFLSNDFKTIYPCKINANTYTVDFSKGKPAFNVKETFTENEIRAYYGIKFIDSWDSINDKVIKVSNKEVSSIQNNVKK